MRQRYWLVFALLGCGEPPSPAPLDAGVDAAGWHATVQLPMRGELHWAEELPLGELAAADLSGNVGTITYGKQTHPAAIYRSIPFGKYQLAAIVSSWADNLLVAYAYCQKGKVDAWYHETLDQPMAYQATVVNGTCQLEKIPTVSEMIFDPMEQLPAGLLHADHASVTGADLAIAEGLGTAQIKGEAWDVNAFNWVDCSKCGATKNPKTDGWYELHSLLRRGPAISFGIFYLESWDPMTVPLEYTFRWDVPSVFPPETSFVAQWKLK